MIAITFLSFMPIIEDPMIRQLGDDDFQKREAATRFLSKVLQHTDGWRNYSLLLKIKKARENMHPEIRVRARGLYNSHYSRYFAEHPYFCIFLDKAQIGEEPGNMSLKKVDRLLIKLIQEGIVYEVAWRCNGTPAEYAVLCYMTKGLDVSKVNKLKAHKEVTRVVPLTDDKKVPWLRAK